MPIKYRILCNEGHLTVYRKKAEKELVDSGKWCCRKQDEKYGPPCGGHLAWKESVYVKVYQKGPTPGTELVEKGDGTYEIPGVSLKVWEGFAVGDKIPIVRDGVEFVGEVTRVRGEVMTLKIVQEGSE